MYIIPYIQISELYFDRLLRKLTCLSEFSKVKWFWFCEILKEPSTANNPDGSLAKKNFTSIQSSDNAQNIRSCDDCDIQWENVLMLSPFW